MSRTANFVINVALNGLVFYAIGRTLRDHRTGLRLGLVLGLVSGFATVVMEDRIEELANQDKIS